MILKKLLIFLTILTMLNTLSMLACTTAIVSGKNTPDGRPLLVKHRDSGFEQNKLVYFNDGKYNYIGLVNSVDSLGQEVWGGCNSAGFAIINSASYNLKEKDDTTSIKDREGIIMKLALQQCETLEDFEKLLADLPKPLGVEANFGVIDASGGCAYYETNNFTFKKIDVNDLSIAPFGYVIRTNYSIYGEQDDGYGYIRYLNAEDLFYNAAGAKDLTHRFILQDVSRSLKHSLTGEDFSRNITVSSNEIKFVSFQDFIPRSSSVSTVLIQGVKSGESPSLTTLWTILGFQLTSVAIPSWVEGGSELPYLLVADETGNAPLCEKALRLKDECFPIKRGSGYRYLNLPKVVNKENTGYQQVLRSIEDEILKETDKRLNKWREENILPREEARNLYMWIDKKVNKFYKEKFEL